MITRARSLIQKHLETQWLSQSRVSDVSCLYRYDLRHNHNLTRRWNPAPLRRGTLVHAGFETALLWDWAARHLDAFGKGASLIPDALLASMLKIGERAIREKQAEWLEDPRIKAWVDETMCEAAEDLVKVSIRVFRRSFTALGVHTGKWKTVAAPNGKPFIEYAMDVPFPGWAGFRGMLDWVAMDERGHIWLWDFKTRKALKPHEYDRLQIQAPCYQRLLKETLGVDLVGTVTYQIRAAVRKVPKMNKVATKQPDGTKSRGLSRTKIATDWPTYLEAVHANGLDPEQYLEMQAKLPEKFDIVGQYYRGPRETSEVWNDVVDTVAVLENAHYTGRYPRNINPFTCAGCSYRSYCESDLQDEDLEVLEQSEYMREDDKRYGPSLTIIGDDNDD